MIELDPRLNWVGYAYYSST